MINNVTLLGRLTSNPELRATASGISVTSLCIAVDRRYTKDGEKQTDFINCVAWQSTADFICKYFSKGDAIAITGEIQTRKYKDRDGNNRVAFEIVINNASFCGSNKNGNNAAGNVTPPEDFNFIEINANDIPF